ncbi:hypothetical protein [Ideonella sp. A 288]|nr:hypothetical protein [Ideonella sp. A 288]
MRSEVRIVVATLVAGIVSWVVSVAVADLTCSMPDLKAPLFQAFVHQK